MKRPSGFDSAASRASIEAAAAMRRIADPPAAAEAHESVDVNEAVESHETVELTDVLELTGAVEAAADLDEPGALDHTQQLSEPDIKAAKESLQQAERARKRRERFEQRRFTAHRRRRARFIWAVVAAVAALAVFVAVAVFTPIMAVRTITIEGANQVSVEDVRASLSRFEGVPLALVRDDQVHQALETFPLIQKYAIERIPPGELLIRIVERTPAIALEQDGEFALFDPAGVLLSKVPEVPQGVPVASGELSDTSSDAFRAATSIVNDMPPELRGTLSKVRATNGQDVTFTLASGTEVVWGEPKETRKKAAVLTALLAAVGTPSFVDVSAPDAPVFR